MAKKDQMTLVAIFLLWSLIFAQTTTFVLCARDAATTPKAEEATSPSAEEAASPSSEEAASPSSEPDEETAESKTAVVPDKAFIIPSDDEKITEWFAAAMKKIEEKKELEPDLVAAEKNPKIITVSQKGKADFKSIKEAVDSIEDKNTYRVIIKIDGGIYEEQVTIDGDNPFVSLIGNPKDVPTLKFDGTTQKSGLMDSATLAVEGDYFQASNLIVQNTAKPKENGELGGNGIALRVKGDAAYFYNCNFESEMDTVRDDDGRHFFIFSIVKGNNDLIFGDGRSLYLAGDVTLPKPLPDGSITANEREDPKDDAGGGFVLALNTFDSQVEGDDSEEVYWGRPGAAGARVVIAYSKVYKNLKIKPERWESNEAHADYDKTVFFAEIGNKESDQAADLSKAKFGKELKEEEANKYITLDYIQATKWLTPIPEYGPKKEERRK